MSWTRKLLPRSLRARLILSFGALIFLTLFLAGTATVYLLRDEQEKTARERVGRLAEPIALRAAFLEAREVPPAQIEEVLKQEYSDLRILLVDRNSTVVTDTGATLRGQQISNVARLATATSDQPRTAPPRLPPRDSRYQVESFRQRGHDDMLLFSAPFVTIRVPGFGTFFPSLQPVIAVEESDVTQAWRDLLPRLFIVGGVAFLGSVVTAGLLARGITRPLRQITAASEEMARGKYDQQIPSYGGEEVGRLATAFNDMARQVSRSHRTLRDFIANASHELKTPLTSIQGFSQAMIDGALTKPEDYEEAGRIVNDEAIRMRGLVDDLLYLSQVEAGEIVLNLEPVETEELMLATGERFRRRAAQANVSLTVQGVPTPPIRADARRLEQALANIVDNALRHTPNGGRIVMRAGSDDGHVRLAVHNTGSFIPPDVLPRVFDRFFQVDPVRSRANGNSGLGLAITKEIVDAHGGVVTVASDEDNGTEFAITLPAATSEVDYGI